VTLVEMVEILEELHYYSGKISPPGLFLWLIRRLQTLTLGKHLLVKSSTSDHHESGCAMHSFKQTLSAALLKQEAQLVFQTSLYRNEAIPFTDIYTAILHFIP
jgi:hypothetical protein